MPLKVVYVDKEELRKLFNEARYNERVQTGEFRERVLYDAPPRAASGQTQGTQSQRVEYRDWNGRYMATVHQFTRPDRTLGASGLPDPQRVRIGDTVYAVKTTFTSFPTITPPSR